MKISEVLKQHRERMGLSLREFARKCDISHATINFIENEVNPSTGRPMVLSLQTYQKLAKGMGMTVQQLFELLGDDMEVSLTYSEEDQMLITAWHAAKPEIRFAVRKLLDF